tara:strand:+ start:29422 stop:30309 length:888 start_codon:yes stop_codon:yes gene_type:complete
MPNSFTNLNHTLLAEMALEAFVQNMMALTAFSHNFGEAQINKGDKVKVAFVNAADAARDFNGSYVVQDADAEGLDITIDKRKYVSWGLTTEELANQPQISMEMFAKQKGFQLAKAVFQDVMSLVTNSNFGAAVFTGAAGTFDSDDVIDIRTAVQTAGWPDFMRALILSDAYEGALLKDDAIKDSSKSGSTAALREGSTGRLSGFDLFGSSLIPANGENLVGLATVPDGILLASRVLLPEDQDIVNVETFNHPETGITLVMRDWFDPDEDTKKRVLEFNYGRRVGNSAGVKRLASS